MLRREQAEPRRFRQYRYGPLASRLVVPGIASLVGIGLVATNPSASLAFICRVIVIPVGIVGFVLGLWMGRRAAGAKRDR